MGICLLGLQVAVPKELAQQIIFQQISRIIKNRVEVEVNEDNKVVSLEKAAIRDEQGVNVV